MPQGCAQGTGKRKELQIKEAGFKLALRKIFTLGVVSGSRKGETLFSEQSVPCLIKYNRQATVSGNNCLGVQMTNLVPKTKVPLALCFGFLKETGSQ